MAGGSSKSNPAKARKRVEASQESSPSSLVRAKDGSAFTRCAECKRDVHAALIDFHDCGRDAKIKMNLESQVVEKPKEVKKTTEKKKSTSSEPQAKRAKTEKKVKTKGSNKPKRPPTAFFIFMESFRKEYKEAHPDSKDVKVVAKEGGEKWKSLTDEEKKPYQDKAAELKAEYQKALETDGAKEEEDVEAEDASTKDSEEVKEKESAQEMEDED